MPHSILLVEDDARVRERLTAVIARHADFHLLASVGSCAEARTTLAAQAPDALLLDLGLPDGDGVELIPTAQQAGTRVLILCVFADGPRQRAALAAGARGCLLKDSNAREILRSITECLAQPPAVHAGPNHGFP